MDFIAGELEKLELAFINRIKRYGSLSLSEQIKLASTYEFFDELNKSGLSKVIDQVKKEYALIVKDILSKKVSGVRPYKFVELDRVSQLDARAILRSGAEYADRFQSALIKKLTFGQSIKQSLDESSIPEFKHNWNITAIQTAEDQFHSAATAKIFEDEPNQKFILSGVFDSRTRPECKAMLQHQPKEGLTFAEVEAGEATKIVKLNYMKYTRTAKKENDLEYNWNFRGGFNCRHRWEPVR